MESFNNGNFDSVTVAYAKFRNPVVQYFVGEQFLPVIDQGANEANETSFNVDFIYEPSSEEILDSLNKIQEKISSINKKAKFKQQGPALITHWGLSGPAILKLSAWAAREMKESSYKAKLLVQWLGEFTSDEIKQELESLKQKNIKALIANTPLDKLTKRFWQRLLRVSKIQKDKKWADISKKEMQVLHKNLFEYEFEVLGQNRFKEEFVECGGVSLKEVDFRTMESKLITPCRARVTDPIENISRTIAPSNSKFLNFRVNSDLPKNK